MGSFQDPTNNLPVGISHCIRSYPIGRGSSRRKKPFAKRAQHVVGLTIFCAQDMRQEIEQARKDALNKHKLARRVYMHQ